MSLRLLSRFVLRRPGFSFDLMERVRSAELGAAAAAVVEREARREARRQAFLDEVFPRLCDEEAGAGRERFRFWYRLMRDVRLLRPVPEAAVERAGALGRGELAAWLRDWNGACAAVDEARAHAGAVLERELSRSREELWALSGEPRFQEAVWLSNPELYEVGWRRYRRDREADRRPARIRHFERRLHMYLQRLCAKNETTSFFGPLGYGRFGEEATAASAEPVAARRAFFAHWGAEALARAAAADPEIQSHIQARPDPVVAGRQRVELTIPPAELRPLDHLAGELERLPPSPARRRWQERLAALRDACSEFEAAGLERRRAILGELESAFAEASGVPVRRGGEGGHFEDRLLVYEECLAGGGEVLPGAALGRRIARDLEPAVRVCAAAAIWEREHLRRLGAELFVELAGGAAEVPFTSFLAAWRRRLPNPPPAPEAERLRAGLTSLVAEAAAGRVARIAPEAVLRLLDEEPPPAVPAVASPDVLLAATGWDALRRGDVTVVLGELHHGVQQLGWMLTFADDEAAWWEEAAELLPAATPSLQPANLVLRRRMKTAPPELPGPSVEASGATRRPPGVPLHSLVVRLGPDGIGLHAPGEERPLCFHPPAYGVDRDGYALFACFSYPLVHQLTVRTGAHTPRVEIGRLVYQRERWEVDPSEIPPLGAGDDLERLVRCWALRERLGLPERVFVRAVGEPKPVFVDLASPLGLEVLAQVASRSTSLTVSEMLPGPDELWLRGADGPYCCELRLACAVP
jgi:hypothetical protein